MKNPIRKLRKQSHNSIKKNKTLKNKLKESKGLYSKNYKTMPKEMKEDTNK